MLSKKLSDAAIAEVMQLNINAQNVVLKDLTKMSKAVITFKIMPESPEVDLEPIKEKLEAIAKVNGAIGAMQIKEEPIAFGLKAIMVIAMYEVEGADFDKIAEEMKQIDQVRSAEVAKMDLALG